MVKKIYESSAAALEQVKALLVHVDGCTILSEKKLSDGSFEITADCPVPNVGASSGGGGGPPSGSGAVAAGNEAPASILHKDKIDRHNFFARYRKLFSPTLKQTQVNGYNAILNEWESNSGLQDLRWLAYMLATAYHETGKRIEPVREGFAKNDAGAVATVTKLFNQGKIKKNYALADPPGSGLHYFGRGLVQLTHRNNYLKMGNLLGLGTQLVSNPSLALDLEMSAKILVTGMVKGSFTRKKLSDYFNKTTEQWGNARKIVNGLDKSSTIAGYGRNFHRCLTGHGF